MGVYQRLQSFFNFGKWPTSWSNHPHSNRAIESPPPLVLFVMGSILLNKSFSNPQCSLCF